MKNNDTTNIFIIDDDKMLTKALKNELEKNFSKFNVEISTFETGEMCQLNENAQPDVAVVDYHLNSKHKNAMNGMRIIDMFKQKSPSTEIVMFTNEENADTAVKAMHHGAHDYIVKNNQMFRKLNMAVYQCLRIKDLKEELKLQKKLSYISVIIITLLIGVATAISIVAPHKL